MACWYTTATVILPWKGWASAVSLSGTENIPVFPAHGRTQEDGFLKRTFTIDTRMRWGVWGKPSSLLTRLIESGTSIYMLHPRFQHIIMLPVFSLRRLLGIHPLFETIPPRGMVIFTYRVTGHARGGACKDPCAGWEAGNRICLLNRASAAWFTAGWDGKQRAAPPPGWGTDEAGPDAGFPF